jgi:hypothetical protein
MLGFVYLDALRSGFSKSIMQLCAVGGKTGQSDWSEPVSKMAM